MSKSIIIFVIISISQSVYPRSSALDDYWKEQDKVAINSHQDSDGLTIVLSKKENPSKKQKLIASQTVKIKAKKSAQVIIKSKPQKKEKLTSFFVDRKLVKKQIVKPKVITTVTPTKGNKQFFVVEKKQLAVQKMMIKKGIITEVEGKTVTEVKFSNKNQKLRNAESTRKPTEVDWLVEQEINNSLNEFNESAIHCKKGEACDSLPICDNSISKLKLSEIANYYQEVRVRSINDLWLETNTGIQIEKKCIEDFGLEFPNLLTNSITEGLACLDRIKGEGSDFNQISMIGLLQQIEKPLKLKCEKNEKLQKISAEATLFPSDENYPQIKLKKGYESVPAQKLKEILFHELIHTNGYAHQADIEYMYACQDCCRDQNEKKASCQICKKHYASTTDSEYQDDVIQWIKEAKGSGASLMAFVSSMTMRKEKLTIEVEQLIQGMKLNPAFDRIVNFVDHQASNNQTKVGIQSNADDDFSYLLYQLKNGNFKEARQKMTSMRALQTIKSAKKQDYLFSNEQMETLFDQLHSQMNQIELKRSKSN